MLYNFLISQGGVHLQRLGTEPSPESRGGSQPPVPTRSPSAPAGRPGGPRRHGEGRRSAGKLPGEGMGRGERAHIVVKFKGQRGSGAPCPPGPRRPPCLFPLVTHPDRRRSLPVPAPCGDSCRAGAVSPGSARPHRTRPQGARATTRYRPAQVLKITARGSAPAGDLIFL